MNATLGTEIRSRLDTIRDFYGQLLELTARCVDEFSFALLDRTIRERSLVLLRIESEEAALQKISPRPSWSGYGQAREIRNHITSITGFDRVLTSRVSHRMNEIGRELSSLSYASGAAEAYTRQSRH